MMSQCMHIWKKVSITMTLGGIALAIAGCETIPVETNDCMSKRELDAVRKQVIHLASKTGISPAKAGKCSTKEILVDIEIKLNDNQMYDGKLLTDDDMAVLSNYLNNKPQTLHTIKNYHDYIRMMQHKQIIVLPENNQ